MIPQRPGGDPYEHRPQPRPELPGYWGERLAWIAGLVLIALGSLATIFVLIRLISIPDTFFDTAGRGIGIFISLIAAIALIGAGLLRAAEEL